MEFVTDSNFWHKKTVFRLYYDFSIENDPHFMSLFEDFKDKKRIQFARYECEAYLNQDDQDYHYNLFGTMVRMLPIFQAEQYQMLFICDVDQSYGSIVMWFEALPKRIMGEFKEYDWVFKHMIGYEFKYDLYAFNKYLDGTALFNVYTKKNGLDIDILNNFLKEAKKPSSDIYGFERMKTLSRRRKPEEETKYRQGELFSYGIDELFLNRVLINHIVEERPDDRVGQIFVQDRAINSYPLLMFDLQTTPVSQLLDLFHYSFGTRQSSGTDPIQQLNLFLRYWDELFALRYLRGSFFFDKVTKKFVPNHQFLKRATVIDRFKKRLGELYRDDLVKFTSKSYFTNLYKHSQLNYFNIHKACNGVKTPKDFDQFGFACYWFENFTVEPIESKISEGELPEPIPVDQPQITVQSSPRRRARRLSDRSPPPEPPRMPSGDKTSLIAKRFSPKDLKRAMYEPPSPTEKQLSPKDLKRAMEEKSDSKYRISSFIKRIRPRQARQASVEADASAVREAADYQNRLIERIKDEALDRYGRDPGSAAAAIRQVLDQDAERDGDLAATFKQILKEEEGIPFAIRRELLQRAHKDLVKKTRIVNGSSDGTGSTI
jgi:hypothetical protein